MLSLVLGFGCADKAPAPAPLPAKTVQTGRTAKDAHDFIHKLDGQLRTLTEAASLAEWEKDKNFTDATEQAAAKANESVMAFMSQAVRDAVRFKAVPGLAEEDARSIELLRRSGSLRAPDDTK